MGPKWSTLSFCKQSWAPLWLCWSWICSEGPVANHQKQQQQQQQNQKEKKAKWKNQPQKQGKAVIDHQPTSERCTRNSGNEWSSVRAIMPPRMWPLSRAVSLILSIVLNFSYSKITLARSWVFPLNVAVGYCLLLSCDMMKEVCFI